MPVVGFGVFVMLQKQMLGIKARAERSARERAGSPAPTFPGAATTVGEPATPVRNGRAKRAEEPELVSATVRLTGPARARGSLDGGRMP